mgnify:CR=1 FL=1|tara:strand:+ start:1212 stop:2381 length:1170 start_codon:yes stop_codon:yes gene_type:complete
MNFLEKYALSCNLKATKPYLRDSYYPILYKKFIAIDTSSSDAQFKYDHWQKIINILSSSLNQHKIYILQIGNPDDPSLQGVHRINGTANYNQTSFIVKKSELIVSSNSLGLHIASAVNAPSISLVKSKEHTSLYPFWKDNSDFLYGKKDKIFNNKLINTITPETVAQKIAEKLGLNIHFPFETIFIGEKYCDGMEFVETVPDQSVDLTKLGAKSIIYRMDLLFSEKNLIDQLQQGKCTIVTNKKINLKIIEELKDKINEIVYVVESDNDDKEFCEACQNFGISLILISSLSEKDTNAKKIIYMDLGNILRQPSHFDTKKKVKSVTSLKKCAYLSNKYTLSLGKTYNSEASWRDGNSVKGKFSLQDVSDNSVFWKNSDTHWILKKLDLKK